MSELEIGGELVSLSDLAGISMDEVNETRGFGLPRGIYHFKVKEGKFAVIETAAGKKPCAQFTCEVMRVLSLPEGDEHDPNLLVGKEHQESFFLRTDEQAHVAEDIGRIKAFLTDIGATATGITLQDAILNSAGHEFAAPTVRVKSKKDEDVEYVNLKRDKIKAASVADA